MVDADANKTSEPVDNTPRIVGIAILAVAFLSVAAIITFKAVRRRRV